MSSQMGALPLVSSPSKQGAQVAWKEERSAGQLTSFGVGSFAELWTLSYPLMISLFSAGAMVFADRFFLAKLSLDAFNAASEAAVFFMAVEFGIASLASIAEVLVGRAYGARNFPKASKAVWSMIWLSLFSSVLFYPIAFFGASTLFAGSPNGPLAYDYFFVLCCFGPVFPLNCALASFWIGRGRTNLVTWCNIGAALLNVFLDILLIFGAGSIPALGVTGAALATGFSQLAMAVIYFVVFLGKRYRVPYGTTNWRFDPTSFMKAISLGLPQSLALLAQCAAWACFFRIMALASPEHLLVAGISQAVFYLFGFVVEGVSKAASTVVANLIGAKRYGEISLVCRSGVRLHLLFALGIGLVFLLFPEEVLQLFLPREGMIGAETWLMLKRSLCWIWLMLIGEALLFLWSGVLIGFGDTRFILFTGSVLVWIFAVAPAYFAALEWNQGPDIASALACFYYLAIGCAYFWRVRYQLVRRAIA